MPNSGAAQLRELGLKLKAAGDGGLRRQLLAGIRKGGAPLVEDVRQAARTILPHSGGLNEYVASSPIAVRTRLTGTVGIRIVNTKSGASRAGTGAFGSDRGSVRHPVFGHTDRKWSTTHVTPGWFSKTLERKAPETEPFVLAAMNRTATEVCNL